MLGIDLDKLEEMLTRLEAVAGSMADSAEISATAAVRMELAANTIAKSSSSMNEAAGNMRRAMRP